MYFFRHELDASFAEAERAIALNPNNADTLASMGSIFHYAGDERGIPIVGRAATLDPFHPTWLNFTIADDHFSKGEYEEALAAARKIKIPGYFWPRVYLAAIYAGLGRQSEARSAVSELVGLYPGFTIKTLIEEEQKHYRTEDTIRRMVAALRKAGLPE